MRAIVRTTVDRDGLAFERMGVEGGLWVVTVNAGHIVKAVRAAQPDVRLQVEEEAEIPSCGEILDQPGTWLIFMDHNVICSAVHVPKEQSVDGLVAL